MNIKLNPSNSVLTTLNQQRKFLHYNAAAFLIAEVLKPDFLFGKIRLPQRSFVPLVIPKENHPANVSDCPGFGWDRFNSLLSSWYSAVFWT